MWKTTHIALHLFTLLFFLSCNTTDKTAQKNSSAPGDTFHYAKLDSSKIIHRIAFGSCNQQNASQHYWHNIASLDPDLWLWLGDNIYGDTENMEKLWQEYEKILNNPHYQAFTQEVPVIGIWDDHDYGENNAGADFPKKEASAELLLNFLQVRDTAPQRHREGIYSSYLIGPPHRQIQFILLDTRYFRDPLIRGRNGYLPNPDGTILGNAQWQWLKKKLNNIEAQVLIIVSGIQILPTQHRFEKWANFPSERNKLLQLINRTVNVPVVLLSGDRHIAEISKWAGKQPIYEVTASGLTHSWEELTSEPNDLRISPLIKQKNVGMISFNWDKTPVRINLQLRSIDGELLYQHDL